METKNISGKVILLAILSFFLIFLIIIAIVLHSKNPGTDSEPAKSLSSNKIISKQIREIEGNHLDENGIVAPEGVTALIDDIYNGIKDSNHVKHIEKHDTSVYYILDNSIGCHYIAPIPGLASSGSDLAIYSYQPWYSDFGQESTESYNKWAFDILDPKGVEYPNKAINTLEESDITESNAHYLYDEDVTIEKLKNLRGNSIILWAGHGGHSSEYHSTLILTTKFTESLYKDYYDDFYNHRLEEAEIHREKYVAVTSLFFDKYLTDGCLENSIIYLATCHSAEDDVLATALLNKGAAAVYGNSDEVWQSYNNKMCKTVLENLCKGDTTEDALRKAQNAHGETDTLLYFFTRDAHVRYYGENNLTLSTLHSRIKNNSLQGQTPNSDWLIGTWKCRIDYDGEAFLNEIGFSENGDVYIYDSIENGMTFATIYGEWELIEQDGDLYYIELILPGTDENGTAIQFRTRIIIEKQGQQAYIRHLSGQKTDIYYDYLFVRE